PIHTLAPYTTLFRSASLTCSTASRAYWSQNRHWPPPGPKPTDRIELVAERGTDPSPPLDAVGITGRDNGTAGKLGSAREHTPSSHHTPHCSITKENPWQCRLLLASPPRSRPPSGHGHEPP